MAFCHQACDRGEFLWRGKSVSSLNDSSGLDLGQFLSPLSSWQLGVVGASFSIGIAAGLIHYFLVLRALRGTPLFERPGFGVFWDLRLPRRSTSPSPGSGGTGRS
jgi:hypothetical protein